MTSELDLVTLVERLHVTNYSNVSVPDLANQLASALAISRSQSLSLPQTTARPHPLVFVGAAMTDPNQAQEGTGHPELSEEYSPAVGRQLLGYIDKIASEMKDNVTNLGADLRTSQQKLGQKLDQLLDRTPSQPSPPTEPSAVKALLANDQAINKAIEDFGMDWVFSVQPHWTSAVEDNSSVMQAYYRAAKYGKQG